MQQVLFRIPLPGLLPNGIPIYGFGLMLALALFLCTWVASKRAVREGIRPELIQDLALWLCLGGILGARLTYFLAEGESLTHFFQIWDGGLVFYGSAIGGGLTYVILYFVLLRKRGVSSWKLADVIAPSVALGLCLGRIGCFLNGCCYGAVACPNCWQVHYPLSSPPRYALVAEGLQTAAGFTLNDQATDDRTLGAVEPASAAANSGLQTGDLIVKADGHSIESGLDLYAYLTREWPRGKNDLALTVRRGGADVDLAPFRPWTLGLHPTQLYESIGMLLAFLLLLAYYPFRCRPGELMAVLMVCYGIERYLDELLRADPRPIGFERYISLILVGCGVGLLLWLRRPDLANRRMELASAS
jgi:prolipoprotein diacylglyceryltransferase